MQGIARIKFDPALARLYTLGEIDLMLLIIQHEELRAIEQAKREAKAK